MEEKSNSVQCPCTGGCSRHGNCQACVAHHRSIGTLTACMKPLAEKLYSKKEA